MTPLLTVIPPVVPPRTLMSFYSSPVLQSFNPSASQINANAFGLDRGDRYKYAWCWTWRFASVLGRALHTLSESPGSWVRRSQSGFPHYANLSLLPQLNEKFTDSPAQRYLPTYMISLHGIFFSCDDSLRNEDHCIELS